MSADHRQGKHRERHHKDVRAHRSAQKVWHHQLGALHLLLYIEHFLIGGLKSVAERVEQRGEQGVAVAAVEILLLAHLCDTGPGAMHTPQCVQHISGAHVYTRRQIVPHQAAGVHTQIHAALF